jgi:hypothetical protein
VLDFGEVQVGEKKTLSLQVQNPSARPVLIYRLILTCNCMSGSAERLSIAPGDTVAVPISFTGQPGKRTWSTQASLITDEAGACKYDVPILGKVEQDFLLEPETLNFGHLVLHQKTAAQTIVKRRDGEPFAMVAVKTSRPDVSFTWDPPSPAKARTFTITATLSPSRPGTLGETAAVITDKGESVAPLIILGAEVEGNLTCTPAIAGSTWPGAGTSPEFDVTIRHKSGAPVKVTDVKESRQAQVTFKMAPAHSWDARLIITFAERIPSGPPVGEFLVSVEGEAEPFHVPYRIDPPGPSSGKP